MKVPALNEEQWIFVAVGIAALWLMSRGIGGVASDITQGAVNAATGAAAGSVIGIGQAVGIPATNQTQCQIDLAAGNTGAASLSCPAGTFISSFFN